MHLSSIATASLLLAQFVSWATAQKSWEEAYALAKPLVDKMSLEQKVGMATGVGFMQSNCVGNTLASTNPDFPALCLQDGPLGVRMAYNVTLGLSGITAAQSFDKDIMHKRGMMMGEEFRGKGVNIQLGPAMNFMRSPEGGRGWESFGECEYLSGVAASETVKGIQSQGVIATAKHFVLNDQETNRQTESTVVDDRTLHEIYLWPFARSVEAGVGSVMCSYNEINSTYACENDHTLNQVLKGELNFQGFVMSDWFGTHSGAKAVNAGLDMDMPGDTITSEGLGGPSYFGANLIESVKNGSVPESRVTDMATRIAAAWYKMGQNENYPKSNLNSFNMTFVGSVNVKGDHPQIVRSQAAAATVLLRNNDNILPLTEHTKSIAIVGSDAFYDPLMNNATACSYYECDPATVVQGGGSGTITFVDPLIAPVDGIKARAGHDVTFHTTNDNYDLESAETVAKSAEIAIVFANTDSSEGSDRTNLTLYNNGDNLIQAVADANENTIVVIHSVGAALMPWIDHPNIKAIVWPGLPGEQSGNSLADILFGDVNPSGRLPYTIAKQLSDYPASISNESVISYTEKLLIGFKWFDAKNVEPLFPFGFGLSYTNFAYNKLKVNTNSKKSQVDVSIEVENTGKVEGSEVVQLYLSFPESAGEPPKLLRGFEKVTVRAGQRSKVSFQLGKTELSIWDVTSQKWVIPSGKFQVHAAASSRDIRESASFEL
ncbi:glycoside hydrolase superfamily [Umbelopsis sp. PMI_123]|nr:glycoside hydrolase superfamily [Umbelopsis sp. PMI_123]